MNRIASPWDLQAELHSILTYVQSHPGRPRRQVVASKLRTLADRLAAKPSSAEVDALVLEALEHTGPGTVLSNIVPDDPSIRPRDVQNALTRLQKKRLAFSHDSHGSLTIWGGVKQGRYWSTRKQVEKLYGYDESDLDR
jgi:hypothetical protein